MKNFEISAVFMKQHCLLLSSVFFLLPLPRLFLILNYD